MERLTAEQAIAQAIAATGFDDFGPDDFQEGLERTLAGFADARLNPAGYAEATKQTLRDLSNRLQIEHWYKTHSQIDAGTIDGPLLVFGLPRTGTTATVAMLALDPQFRFLRAWEATAPVPPPILGQEEQDPRARAAREVAANFLQSTLHLADPDGPEEDLVMLAGLNQHHFHGRFPMPDDFINWWIEEDFGSTYAYHERALKLLQSERPPNKWLLKAPVHLFKLEAFAARYPGAKFVMTHRDPAKIVSSVASLYQSLYAAVCDEGVVDGRWTGNRCLSFWAEGARRGLAARQRIGEHRFIDIYNRDVVRDPIAAFEQLYEQLGLTIGTELRSRLEQYHRNNAQGKFGAHHHAPEDFGLTTQQIRSAFREYIDRFEL